MNKDQNSQEKYLPIANISRIMKKALPKNTKISKEAKETFQECVSEFIGFVTSEASEKCIKENRKTVNGDDILYSLTLLGYEAYVEPLRMYLNKYRDFYKQEGNNSDEEDSDQVEQQNNSDKKNSQEKLE